MRPGVVGLIDNLSTRRRYHHAMQLEAPEWMGVQQGGEQLGLGELGTWGDGTEWIMEPNDGR